MLLFVREVYGIRIVELTRAHDVATAIRQFTPTGYFNYQVVTTCEPVIVTKAVALPRVPALALDAIGY